jgi:hypothetical protein
MAVKANVGSTPAASSIIDSASLNLALVLFAGEAAKVSGILENI